VKEMMSKKRSDLPSPPPPSGGPRPGRGGEEKEGGRGEERRRELERRLMQVVKEAERDMIALGGGMGGSYMSAGMGEDCNKVEVGTEGKIGKLMGKERMRGFKGIQEEEVKFDRFEEDLVVSLADL
jgi:hypothetical protein